MNDATNICLACGLCCTGTLVGFVQLDADEVPRVREFMDIEEDNGNGVFLQPCKKYCDGCTVYEKRPKQCASFKCGLLKSVEQKELDFHTAVEVVVEVKLKKIALEKKIAALQIELDSPSFYFKMVELKKILKNKNAEVELSQSYLELQTEFNELDHLLHHQFDVSLF